MTDSTKAKKEHGIDNKGAFSNEQAQNNFVKKIRS